MIVPPAVGNRNQMPQRCRQNDRVCTARTSVVLMDSAGVSLSCATAALRLVTQILLTNNICIWRERRMSSLRARTHRSAEWPVAQLAD